MTTRGVGKSKGVAFRYDEAPHALSILDREYNRGIDTSIEEACRDILALQSMGAEFGKDQFDWVHDRIRNLEQLILHLERLKV